MRYITRKEPNIAFIIQDYKMPSSRARVLELIPYLQNYFSCIVLSYPEGLLSRLKLFKMIPQFDVVFLQKKLITPAEAFLIRARAKRFVFDFDDAIMYRHDVKGGDLSHTRFFRFKTIVRLADLVVAGNKVLEGYAKPFNKNVVVIPTGVPSKVPVKRSQKASKMIRIGWIGGNINLYYLSQLAQPLKDLAKKYPYELVIISGKSIELDGIKISLIPWKYRWQYHVLSQLDIGIMPLLHTKYAEGKCGYKALQYMTVGVPPVCSRVGAIDDIIVDGQHGLLVDELPKFSDALSLLIEDPKTRRYLGENARNRVLEEFTLEKVAARLRLALEALL